MNFFIFLSLILDYLRIACFGAKVDLGFDIVFILLILLFMFEIVVYII